MSISIRPGGAADLDSVLAMFDGAVDWLAARGSAGQWGTTPFSENPARVERVREMIGEGLYLAEIGGEPAGALVITERCPPHVPAVTEREVYVNLLLTDRRHAGRGVGARLLEFAEEQARDRGIGLLRVDCWAGGDGTLVRYYLGRGFQPTEQFDVNGWIGQVFQRTVTSAL